MNHALYRDFCDILGIFCVKYEIRQTPDISSQFYRVFLSLLSSWILPRLTLQVQIQICLFYKLAISTMPTSSNCICYSTGYLPPMPNGIGVFYIIRLARLKQNCPNQYIAKSRNLLFFTAFCSTQRVWPRRRGSSTQRISLSRCLLETKG